LKENVLKHDFVPLPESVSSEIVEIITSCLKKDPRERPTS
jgi:serine/threonine protein kinase